MSEHRITSITLITKPEMKLLAHGLGCGKKFEDVISDADQQLLNKRLDEIIKKFKNSRNPDSGYIFLNEYSNQFIFYHNFHNLITVVTVSTKDLAQFFKEFLVLTRNISILAMGKKSPEEIFVEIKNNLMPEMDAFECHTCTVGTCIPQLSRLHINHQFRVFSS